MINQSIYLHPGTGKEISKDDNLAEAYQKFGGDNEKSNKDILLYTRINDLNKTFFTTLFETLKMQVKMNED